MGLDLGSELGLAWHGSHMITDDDTALWRVISVLVCALTCCTPLVVETPLEAWFYHQI